MEDAVDVVFPNEVGPEVGQGILYFSAVICILQEDLKQSVEAVGVLGDVRSLLYELKEGVVSDDGIVHLGNGIDIKQDHFHEVLSVKFEEPVSLLA